MTILELLKKMSALIAMTAMPLNERNIDQEKQILKDIQSGLTDGDFDNPDELAKLQSQINQVENDLAAASEKMRGYQRAQMNSYVPVNRSYSADGRHMMRFSSPELAKEFGAFCLMVMRAEHDPSMRKDMNPAVGGEGGYLIPNPSVSAEIFYMASTMGVAAAIGLTVPCGPGGIESTTSLGGATAYWKAAGAEATESTPSLSKTRMTPETLISLIEAPGEIEDDALIVFGNYIASELAYSIRREVDRAAFQGTGAPSDGGIVGILNSDRVTIVTMDDGDTDFSDITFDDLVDMEAHVAEAAQDNGTWLMHRTILAAIKKKKTDSGDLIWQPASAKEPAMLLGYPYRTSAQMRGTSSSAANTTFMAFGDFRQGLIIAPRGQIAIDFSRHAGFRNYSSVYRALYRIDVATRGYTASEMARNDTLENPIVVLKTNNT